MNDDLIVPIFVLIDDVMRLLGHRTHPQAGASDSEVLTVATVAACQFQNHQERALCMMRALHYLSGDLSVSRFNRRLHALVDWLPLLLDLVGEVFATGEAFVIDICPEGTRTARLSAGTGGAMHEGAGGGVLRLLCGPKGAVLRLAVASDCHPDRRAGVV
jgi:hypothetical protein